MLKSLKHKSIYTFGLTGALSVATVALITGCPTTPPGGGTNLGNLAGTVTNGLTGAGISGVAVVLDPAIEGVEITTAENGSFSESLPSGVYTVTFETSNFEAESKTVAVVGGSTARADAALAPLQLVIVSASVEGDAVPGGALTASVTVEVLDGSATVDSYSWSQTGGVTVTVDGSSTAAATVSLPSAGDFKDLLFQVLAEPPISEAQLPSNVSLPEGEFPGGLQDRFQVVGLSPFSLEEAALVTLEVTVTTSSGTFTSDVEIHTSLPWKSSLGIGNVAIGGPVLLHGKIQDAYAWNLSGPAGSNATLADANAQNPDFTPDVSGSYTVTEATSGAELVITAGTWAGAITGLDDDGRPEADTCTICHNGTIAADQFSSWAQTGHADIFSVNLNTSTHYSTSCLSCHTVGWDPDADNGGMDDVADYDSFLAEFTTDGSHFHADSDNWTGMLARTPASAQLANIQCENCHGPNPAGHAAATPGRTSISSDVCAVCHGEPLRHARFQQWQLSKHANYELAIEEGENGNCARCHTGNGFLAWLPTLLDDDPATDPLENIEITWTTDEIHPMTCVICHDPHSIGTTTGIGTDATMRISGDTPPLIAGFTAVGVGRGAICMTCHNSRRGLRNDDNFDASDAARAPHGGPQADVLMGQNAFFMEVGVRGNHSFVQDSCVNCHMEQTPPPDLLSYNQGGTNHTFFASSDICDRCHGEAFGAEGVQTAYEASALELETKIESAIIALIAGQIAAGNTIDLGGEAVITAAGDIAGVEFGEYHGRQAITVALADGTTVGPIRLPDVDVLDAAQVSLGELYDFADTRLAKAGWNWNLANNDGSRAVHNPTFVFQVLDKAIDALNELAAE